MDTHANVLKLVGGEGGIVRLSRCLRGSFVHTPTPQIQKAPAWVPFVFGGEGGIRTHGNVNATPDFESGTFDHSATSPE